jgi:parallel beta-helix repeat protein
MTFRLLAVAVFMVFSAQAAFSRTVTISQGRFPAPGNGARALAVQKYVAAQVRPGDTVLFAKGVLELDGPIYVCDSIVLRGTLDSLGKNKSMLKRHYSWNGEERKGIIWDKGKWAEGEPVGGRHAGLISICFGHNTVCGVTVRDLDLEGNNYADAESATGWSRLSMIFLAGSGIKVVHCNVRNSPYMGMILWGGRDNTVDSCSVFNTGCDGILAGGSHTIRITNNRINRTRDNAIGFDCFNVSDENQKAAFAGGNGSLIAGNTIDNSDTAGYKVGDIRGPCRADNNYHSSYGIYVGRNRSFTQMNVRGEIAAVESVTVNGNTVVSPWLHGIFIESYCRHITITGNTVTGVRRWHGIVLEGHNSDVLISNNNVAQVPWFGINVIDGKGITVRNNDVSFCEHAAIAEECTSPSACSILMTGNTVRNCGKGPFFVKGVCTDCKSSDNTIK